MKIKELCFGYVHGVITGRASNCNFSYICTARPFYQSLTTGKTRCHLGSLLLWLGRATKSAPGFFVPSKSIIMHVQNLFIFATSFFSFFLNTTSSTDFYLLKMVFGFAIIFSIIFINQIVDYFTMTSGIERKRKKFNDLERRLRKARKNQNAEGLKRSELSFLKLNQIDFEDSMMNLRKHYPSLYERAKRKRDRNVRYSGKGYYTKPVKSKNGQFVHSVHYK